MALWLENEHAFGAISACEAQAIIPPAQWIDSSEKSDPFTDSNCFELQRKKLGAGAVSSSRGFWEAMEKTRYFVMDGRFVAWELGGIWNGYVSVYCWLRWMDHRMYIVNRRLQFFRIFLLEVLYTRFWILFLNRFNFFYKIWHDMFFYFK